MKIVYADFHLMDSADQSFQQGLRISFNLDFFRPDHHAPDGGMISDFMTLYWTRLASPNKIKDLDFSIPKKEALGDPAKLDAIAIEETRAALSLLLSSRIRLRMDEDGFVQSRLRTLMPDPANPTAANHLFTLGVQCDPNQVSRALDLLLDEISECFMGEARIEILDLADVDRNEQASSQEAMTFTSSVLTDGSLGLDSLPGHGDLHVTLNVHRPTGSTLSARQAFDRAALTALVLEMPPTDRCTPGRRMESAQELVAKCAQCVLSRLQPGCETHLLAEDWSAVFQAPDLRLDWLNSTESIVDIDDVRDVLAAMAESIQDLASV